MWMYVNVCVYMCIYAMRMLAEKPNACIATSPHQYMKEDEV